jgi:hypothetical protein
VGELWLDGKQLPTGVYTSSAGWLEGGGYVVAGGLKYVDVSGLVGNPNKRVGAGNIARLGAASTLELPEGECSVHVATRGFPLTLVAGGANTRFSGSITGDGSVRIEAPADHRPLEISGTHASSYRGATTLARGVLKLSRPGAARAIPGELTLGGSAAGNKGDGVVCGADDPFLPSAVVTLQGAQPSFLDVNGHKVTLGKVVLSRAAAVRLGKGGALRVRQLVIAGRRLEDGVYAAGRPWPEGTGKVTVDARIDVRGVIGSPDTQVGQGDVANLVGDTRFCYPAAGCHVDVITNGFTLVLDSGDGNPFSCTGCNSGSGNLEFFMGPSHTGFKDAPLRLGATGPTPRPASSSSGRGACNWRSPGGSMRSPAT